MRAGRRFYRFLRLAVIGLPALLFVSALLLPWIPGATGLFSDSAGPWYQPVTSPLFLAALAYAYPVTHFCTRLVSDDMFFSPGYFGVLAVYTVLWMILLRCGRPLEFLSAGPLNLPANGLLNGRKSS